MGNTWRFAGLRSYTQTLQNDLRKLEEWLNYLSSRVDALDGTTVLNRAGNTGIPDLPPVGAHAWTHADGGSDPILPYNFTWTGKHIFAPNTDVVAVTVKGTYGAGTQTDGRTTNIVEIKDAAGTNLLEVDPDGNVGLVDDPDARFTVRNTGGVFPVYPDTAITSVSLLDIWYDADHGVSTSGANVTSWAPKVSNIGTIAQQTLGGARKQGTITYTTDADGYNYLRFGSSGAMGTASTILPVLRGGAAGVEGTLVFVCAWKSAYGFAHMKEYGTPAGTHWIAAYPANAFPTCEGRYNPAGFTSYVTGSTTLTGSVNDYLDVKVLAIVGRYTTDGGVTISGVYYLNNSDYSISPVTGPAPGGSINADGVGWPGQVNQDHAVYQIISWRKKLSVAELEQVSAYLRGRYQNAFSGGVPDPTGGGADTLDLTRYKNSAGTVLSRVDERGYIGIGVDPTYPLDVIDTSTQQIRFGYDSSTLFAKLSVDAGGDIALASGTANVTYGIYSNAGAEKFLLTTTGTTSTDMRVGTDGTDILRFTVTPLNGNATIKPQGAVTDVDTEGNWNHNGTDPTKAHTFYGTIKARNATQYGTGTNDLTFNAAIDFEDTDPFDPSVLPDTARKSQLVYGVVEDPLNTGQSPPWVYGYARISPYHYYVGGVNNTNYPQVLIDGVLVLPSFAAQFYPGFSGDSWARINTPGFRSDANYGFTGVGGALFCQATGLGATTMDLWYIDREGRQFILNVSPAGGGPGIAADAAESYTTWNDATARLTASKYWQNGSGTIITLGVSTIQADINEAFNPTWTGTHVFRGDVYLGDPAVTYDNKPLIFANDPANDGVDLLVYNARTTGNILKVRTAGGGDHLWMNAAGNLVLPNGKGVFARGGLDESTYTTVGSTFGYTFGGATPGDKAGLDVVTYYQNSGAGGVALGLGGTAEWNPTSSGATVSSNIGMRYNAVVSPAWGVGTGTCGYNAAIEVRGKLTGNASAVGYSNVYLNHAIIAYAEISGEYYSVDLNAPIEIRAPVISATNINVVQHAGLSIQDQTHAQLGTAAALLVHAQTTSSAATKGNIEMKGADWNTGHIQLKTGHMWFDGTYLRGKNSAPSSSGDGGRIVLGTGQTYTPTNVTTDRSYDADATTINELADVLGTLIADLQTSGVIA